MNHELKTWPVYFDRIERGEKQFEVRKNDRDFQTGDVLYLRKWNPTNCQYTEDRMLVCEVTYILHGPQFGIQEGFCVMSIQLTDDGR